MSNRLSWLPPHPDFSGTLKKIKLTENPNEKLEAIRSAAKHDIDFLEITNLDRQLQNVLAQPSLQTSLPRLRLAVLGSFTLEQVLPSIRIAALRRGLIAEIYLAPYNLYRQELFNASSGFHAFKADVVLFAIHPYDVGISLALNASAEEARQKVNDQLQEWTQLWSLAKKSGATVIHQTLAIPPEHSFGHLDAMVPTTATHIFHQLNHRLREKAPEQSVLILDTERIAAMVGKKAWFDPAMWFHAKQAVPETFAPLYGDHVARILASLRGLSAKCLVLDLDNTLWGGVIGDDGLDGIVLGQGNGVGEAFQAFQAYAKRLKERGIILAVCSKNDVTNAKSPFEKHPEMVLRLDDIVVFIANWNDKAANLRSIAAQLNIGLDSLVFFDDNPAERALVRQLAPDVHVPEVPEDPALYVPCLSDSGCFEAIGFTADDAVRVEQYKANAKRTEMLESGQSVDDFLQGLEMEMTVSPFDEVGRARIAQLINKSNQYNLTTRRYTEDQVASFAANPDAVTFQIRLKDKCGDNGMISVLIAKPDPNDRDRLIVDTWLMSCRVLGRQVENAALNALADVARQRGYKFIEGDYIPTAKNSLVKDHYEKLGFKRVETPSDDGLQGRTRWQLALNSFKNHSVFMNVTCSSTPTPSYSASYQ